MTSKKDEGKTLLEHRQERLQSLRNKGKKILKPVFELKKEQREKLMALLAHASPQIKKNYKLLIRAYDQQINALLREENADLIKKIQTLSEQIQKHKHLMADLLRRKRILDPQGTLSDQEVAELFFWKQDNVQRTPEPKQKKWEGNLDPKAEKPEPKEQKVEGTPQDKGDQTPEISGKNPDSSLPQGENQGKKKRRRKKKWGQHPAWKNSWKSQPQGEEPDWRPDSKSALNPEGQQKKSQQSLPAETQGKLPEKPLGAVTEADLLKKPNMTAEDKKNMHIILAFMKKKNSLRTDENLKKLYDNVRYHHNAIEIAGRKWSRSYRESSKVGPNNREYISDPKDVCKPRAFYKQKTGLQYFNHAAALEEQKEMKKLGQKLPSKDDLEATLQALPGEYKKEKRHEEKWHKGGHIFYLLFNGARKYTDYCRSGGELNCEALSNCLWSSSECGTDTARSFLCDDTGGFLCQYNIDYCFVLRAVFQ